MEKMEKKKIVMIVIAFVFLNNCMMCMFEPFEKNHKCECKCYYESKKECEQSKRRKPWIPNK